MAARTEPIRIGQFDLDRVAGELRICADEVEPASLPHRAAAAIAADEPTATERLASGVNAYVFVRSIECLDTETAPDLDSHGARSGGQDAFDMFEIDRQAGAGRTGEPIVPRRGVDPVGEELDAGKMAGGTARLMHPMRGLWHTAAVCVIIRALRARNVVQQPAPV